MYTFKLRIAKTCEKSRKVPDLPTTTLKINLKMTKNRIGPLGHYHYTREVSTAGVLTKGSTFLLFSTSTQRVKKFQLPSFFFFTEEQQFLTCMLCIYMHTVSVTWCMHTFIALCNIIKFSFAQQSMTILRSHISHSQHRPFTLSFLCSPT
jgi:hypothetical protein